MFYKEEKCFTFTIGSCMLPYFCLVACFKPMIYHLKKVHFYYVQATGSVHMCL